MKTSMITVLIGGIGVGAVSALMTVGSHFEKLTVGLFINAYILGVVFCLVGLLTTVLFRRRGHHVGVFTLCTTIVPTLITATVLFLLGAGIYFEVLADVAVMGLVGGLLGSLAARLAVSPRPSIGRVSLGAAVFSWIALVGLHFAVDGGTPTSDLIVKVDSTNFQRVVIEAKGPVVVDFSAPWCTPCRMMLPHLEAVAARNPNVVFATIDVDASPELRERCGVKPLPTLITYTNGQPSEPLIGYQNEQDIDELVRSAIAQHKTVGEKKH